MDKARLEIFPGVWLDHRRALFLEEERVLAVADLHLGYAWAHRFHGQLMPLQPDGVRERLNELCGSYRPRTLVILGDMIHRAVPVRKIAEELLALVQDRARDCAVRLILGNHDRGVERIVPKSAPIEFHDSMCLDRFVFVHGDQPVVPTSDGITIMGHEHPCLALGDGVRSARFPAFWVGPRAIILPAFSRWAAGVELRTQEPMSALARAFRFEKAVGILNGKLLPIPLPQAGDAEPPDCSGGVGTGSGGEPIQ